MGVAPIKVKIKGDDQLSKDMRKIHSRVKKFSQGLKNVGSAMTAGITLPVVMAGGAIFKASYNFDKFMNMVEAKSTVSGKSIEDLRKKALDLGSTTSYSHIQAAEGMNYLAQAGFKTNQIFQAITPTLKLAQATSAELGNTADWLSNIMGGMQWGAERTDEAATILAVTTAKANVNLEQLAGTFSKAGTVGKNFGADLGDIAAAAGFLGNIGIQDEGGTVLKNMFLNMVSGAPKVVDAFEHIGVAVDDGKGNMRDFKEILLDMSQGLQKVSQKEGMQVLDAIMGKRAIAGVTGLTASLKKNNGQFKELVGILNNLENTDLDKMVKTMRKGSVGAWDDAVSALQGLGQAIADSGLQKFIIDALVGLTKVFRFIAKQSPALLKLGTVFLGITAVIGPFLILLGSIIPAISLVITKVIAFGGVAAVWGAIMGAVLSPIGLVIAAVVAFGVYLFVFRKRIKEGAVLVMEQWAAVMVSLGPVLTSLRDSLVRIFPSLDGLGDGFADLLALPIKWFFEAIAVSLYGWSLLLPILIELVEDLVGALQNLEDVIIPDFLKGVITGPKVDLDAESHNLLASMKLEGGKSKQWKGPDKEWQGNIINPDLGFDEHTANLLKDMPLEADKPRTAGAAAVRRPNTSQTLKNDITLTFKGLPQGAGVSTEGKNVKTRTDNGQILAPGI